MSSDGPDPRNYSKHFHLLYGLILFAAAAFAVSCGVRSERRELPPEVEAVVTAIGEDIAQARYEKIFSESADLWKQDSTLEESTSALKTIAEKLGKVKNRTLHSAVEQHNSGGDLKGRVFILTYQTTFERGEGMENFTLVERDHQWLLARYRVNSTALK